MAKPFGKKANDYLRLSTTTEFRQVLENQIVGDSRLSENQIVMVSRGSGEIGGGTWMHEDVAIDFAMWLAPDFNL